MFDHSVIKRTGQWWKAMVASAPRAGSQCSTESFLQQLTERSRGSSFSVHSWVSWVWLSQLSQFAVRNVVPSGSGVQYQVKVQGSG